MNTIGIDVSKAKIDCAWLREEGKLKFKVLPNTKAGCNELIEWSLKSTSLEITQLHFIMEATGVYHEQLAIQLHNAGAMVSVVNPAQVKFYSQGLGVRTKNDKKDSAILARYGLKESPKAWQPEPVEIRTLKALIARFDGIEKDLQREKNRQEKAVISKAPQEVLNSITQMIELLETEQKRLDKLIEDHINKHEELKKNKELLKSIPGVGKVIATRILMVIGSRDFKSASQCSAYLGLVPVEHESGSSIRGRPRLSKAGNPIIRAKLYMAAVVAIQHNPDINAQYERLTARGKSKMSALGAAMRKLVQICFGVLKHQQTYQPQVT
ncbi:transposase [methanotrophic endosymbiont of Bathymodiolus puteoserpentis (Logatchev)]|uniref:transposase n=1 Tax=methanotrophic endosymbiont of Bathymodiolus puteoserpentis (Logatchev) TaxID=343235 RepID=UPI0013CD25B8|nr:transposase [methanotrophic endosymbiont of Bathymodiolus puteoserpentis (Logatchev)]SHE23688.1 Mobile element protein [methanotrophic endosymbiont of Bathymodiolus puteoserpentis (Logatchev)]